MRELSPQERATLALWLLLQSPLTTAEIAAHCEMTRSGALRMLGRMSRIIPLQVENGRWVLRQSDQDGSFCDI